MTERKHHREVAIKSDNSRSGVGDKDARCIWESDPTEDGELVRLDLTPSGELYVSFTDMEEASGAYHSVEITRGDLAALKELML